MTVAPRCAPFWSRAEGFLANFSRKFFTDSPLAEAAETRSARMEIRVIRRDNFMLKGGNLPFFLFKVRKEDEEGRGGREVVL